MRRDWSRPDGFRRYTIEYCSDVVMEQGVRVGRDFHNGHDSYRYRDSPLGVVLVMNYPSLGITDTRTMRDRRQAGKHASMVWLRAYNKRVSG